MVRVAIRAQVVSTALHPDNATLIILTVADDASIHAIDGLIRFDVLSFGEVVEVLTHVVLSPCQIPLVP